MTAWERWKAYPIQVFIAGDQLINALIPPLGSLSYADETLSARIYRAHRDGHIAGKVLMPIVDRVFSLWQRIPNHCQAAYFKERQRANLPPEYR